MSEFGLSIGLLLTDDLAFHALSVCFFISDLVDDRECLFSRLSSFNQLRLFVLVVHLLELSPLLLLPFFLGHDNLE